VKSATAIRDEAAGLEALETERARLRPERFRRNSLFDHSFFVNSSFADPRFGTAMAALPESGAL